MQLRSPRGFAMIPVLLAVTAISAGALLWLGSDHNRQLTNLAEQGRTADEVRTAIAGFTLAHARLPCPDTDKDGTENCTTTQTAGTVPYNTLGLPRRVTGNIGYIPYNPSDVLGLTNSADVKAITIPDDLPGAIDLSSLNSPGYTAPNAPQSNEDAANNVKWLFKKEAYTAGIITNTAKDVNDNPVTNKISSSYLVTLDNDYLSERIDVSSADLDFMPGSSAYDTLKAIRDNFDKLVFNHAAKAAVFDMPAEIKILEDNLKEINLGSTSPAPNPCQTLDCIENRWSDIRGRFNSQVTTYNADSRSDQDLISDNYDEAKAIADADANAKANDPNSATITSISKAAFLSQALTNLGASVREAQIDLGEVIGDTMQESVAKVAENNNNINGDDDKYDGDGKLKSVVPDIVSTYKKYADTDIPAEKTRLEGLISAEQTKDSPDQSAIARWNAEIAVYDDLKDHYTSLAGLMQKLFDDLTNKSILEGFDDKLIYDSNATPPTAQETCDGLKAKYGSVVDDAQCLRIAKGSPDTSDPQTMGAYIKTLEGTPAGLPTTPPTSTTKSSYPAQSNIADLCHKLEAVSSDSSGLVKVGSTNLAYILIQPGLDGVIHNSNQASTNNGSFSRPDRSYDLQYDDLVTAVTSLDMATQLGCSALIASMASMSANVQQAELLYKNATGALEDAEQAVITASIDLALAVVTLAVDTGAIIQETAAGAAATATCVASLGLAVNACIAAGIEFAAAAAHGITVATDAVNIATAGVNLDDSISSRDDAAKTKNDTATHLSNAVNRAVASDARGGIVELPTN